MTKRNHYQTLRVTEDAPAEMIEAAWKLLMRRFHPDGSEPNEEKAKAINSAHDILKDPMKRAAYDAELNAQRVKLRPQPINDRTRAYPPAYPDAYPGIHIRRSDIARVFQEAMTEGLLTAVENAGARVVDHLVKTNPILAHYLNRRKVG